MRSRRRGGALEFEFLGGFAHLGFELGDGLLQFVLVGDVADGHIVRRDGDVIGFDDSRRAACPRT